MIIQNILTFFKILFIDRFDFCKIFDTHFGGSMEKKCPTQIRERKKNKSFAIFTQKLKEWQWRFLCNSTTPSQLFHVPTFIMVIELNPLNSCVLLLHNLILPIAKKKLFKTHLGICKFYSFDFLSNSELVIKLQA